MTMITIMYRCCSC